MRSFSTMVYMLIENPAVPMLVLSVIQLFYRKEHVNQPIGDSGEKQQVKCYADRSRLSCGVKLLAPG